VAAAPQAVTASGAPSPPAPAPPRGEPPAELPAAPASGPGAARLLAIEMAVGGATRAQVAERLHERYGLTDPREILDDVFGGGTAGSSTLPWGRA